MAVKIIFLFYKEAIYPEADELHKENEEIEGHTQRKEQQNHKKIRLWQKYVRTSVEKVYCLCVLVK